MNPTELLVNSARNAGGSAHRYVAVTFAAGSFSPAKPFKGIHVNADTTVVLVGVDGVSATLALTKGSHWLAGRAVTEAGTSPTTGIVALY
jgi:hypothetical protein